MIVPNVNVISCKVIYTKDLCKLLLFRAVRGLVKTNIIQSSIHSDVESKSKDILKLGLLQADMSPQKAHTGIKGQPEWWTFPHKIFQDLFNALYIEQQGEVSTILF